MSNAGTLSTSTILSTLTKDFQPIEGAIISGVAGFFVPELLKLGEEELANVYNGLKHFVNNLKSGMSWGEAMASMLTEVWNDEKSDLAGFATDFVDAVGKVLQSVGIVAAA